MGRGEQSIEMQQEDSIKKGGKGPAANAWGHHDIGSKSQSGGNLGNGGKGQEWLLYRQVISC